MYRYQYYERFSIGDRVTPVVKWLLVTNVVAFLLYAITFRIHPEAGRALTLWLGLNPALLFRHLFLWQLVTYMFLHSLESLFHIIFNMLFLYWFGCEVERLFGSRRFLLFYLSAGIFAGLVYCAIHIFSPLRSTVIGASGAIMALLVVYAVYYPNQIILFMFIFPMRIRTFVLLMIALDLYVSVMGAPNGVANVAHLGGAGYGFLFIRARPWVESGLASLEERWNLWRQQRERAKEERLDAILEKVHRDGLHTLSAGERRFLAQMSRRKRR